MMTRPRNDPMHLKFDTISAGTGLDCTEEHKEDIMGSPALALTMLPFVGPCDEVSPHRTGTGDRIAEASFPSPRGQVHQFPILNGLSPAVP